MCEAQGFLARALDLGGSLCPLQGCAVLLGTQATVAEGCLCGNNWMAGPSTLSPELTLANSEQQRSELTGSGVKAQHPEEGDLGVGKNGPVRDGGWWCW